MNSIKSDTDHVPCVIECYKADGAYGGGTCYSIVGDHENRPTDMTNLIIQNTPPNALHSARKRAELRRSGRKR